MADHVRKMNDKYETVIDTKHVVYIKKRERKYSTCETDYYVDVFLDIHPPFNKIELEYANDEPWRNKEYDGIKNRMELS